MQGDPAETWDERSDRDRRRERKRMKSSDTKEGLEVSSWHGRWPRLLTVSTDICVLRAPERIRGSEPFARYQCILVASASYQFSRDSYVYDRRWSREPRFEGFSSLRWCKVTRSVDPSSYFYSSWAKRFVFCRVKRSVPMRS